MATPRMTPPAGVPKKDQTAPRKKLDPNRKTKPKDTGYGPGQPGPIPVPGQPKPNIDDKIYRTMPITEPQLKQIKKAYGIK